MVGVRNTTSILSISSFGKGDIQDCTVVRHYLGQVFDPSHSVYRIRVCGSLELHPVIRPCGSKMCPGQVAG